MAKRGLYYQLVESQQTNSTPSDDNSAQVDFNERDSNIPHQSNHAEDSSPAVFDEVSLGVASVVLDKPQQSIERDNDVDKDVSIWRILRMNKPEWVYITLGVIGATIQGLSTPVYAMIFGELMGLLDPSLEGDAMHMNNILALVT